MQIDWRKTKVLTVKSGTCDISVKGEKIEKVKVMIMKYLGALFNEVGTCEEEIKYRIGLQQR